MVTFRYYCLVAMGDKGMDSIKDDILKIAETKPRYIDAKGILIATFASIATPRELETFLNHDNRSFFIFDLNKNNSGYHMNNQGLQEHLFGLMGLPDKLNEKANKIKESISANTKHNTAEKVIKQKIKKVKTIDYSSMSNKEREEIVNNILDKGHENLSNEDKGILNNISKLTNKS